MKPKKLIREKLIENLKPEEYEKIENLDELNRLYKLKIKEELEEIKNSNYKDFEEFGDLWSVFKSWVIINNYDADKIGMQSLWKDKEKGNYSNYALTNLNPNNPSNKIYFQNNEYIEYIEYEDIAKKQKEDFLDKLYFFFDNSESFVKEEDYCNTTLPLISANELIDIIRSIDKFSEKSSIGVDLNITFKLKKENYKIVFSFEYLVITIHKLNF